MKKILLPLLLMFAAVFANAQIVNGGFEAWETDTSYFPGATGILAGDTFAYQDPTAWTSSNVVTGDTALGHFFFVTQDADAHGGGNAAKFRTDTAAPLVVPGFGMLHPTVPGFALNGKFSINFSGLAFGGTLTPMKIPGAGQPLNGRLENFKGWFKYHPVIVDSANHITDSCLIWATLRKGNVEVANAIFKSTDTTDSYTQFSVPFTYVSCEIPDTLVILVASSIPDLTKLLTGSSGLKPGSELLVDDLSYDTIAGNHIFAPLAVRDFDTTEFNTPVALDVTSNDADCNGQSLTVSILTNPLHGTASLSGNTINYTPTTGVYGRDSVQYQITNTSSLTASAWAHIYVKNQLGINDLNLVHLTVYPVPASNQLTLQFENTGKTVARVYDVVGNLVAQQNLLANTNQMDISKLANGLYGIELTNESNAVVARTKFIVAK